MRRLEHPSDPTYTAAVPLAHQDRFPTTRPPDWASLRHALSVVRVESPIELHLVRHGQTQRNELGIVTGAAEVDLSPLGREQAAALGQRLGSEYALALTSSMRRARQTLDLALASSRTKAPTVLVEPRLNERALGELEGRPARAVQPYAEGDLDWAPEGGESYRDVARRVLWFLVDLALWTARHKEPKVLLSTHSGPLRILMGTLDQSTDSRAVLARTFENATLERRVLRSLALPPFLQRL